MEYVLTATEVRVLGCLLEKEATTPDAYPLTLNSLTNACNQKTNREPVMNLAEATVMEAVESLIKKTLASSRSGAGSRVSKYSHRLTGRLRDEMCFSPPEIAVLCVLFLRGPQTLGEIRMRCARIYEFTEMAELNAVLETLGERKDGPFVVRLARRAGHKESRYAHLFAGEVSEETPAAADTPALVVDDASARMEALEIRVGQLSSELAELRETVEKFVHPEN